MPTANTDDIHKLMTLSSPSATRELLSDSVDAESSADLDLLFANLGARVAAEGAGKAAIEKAPLLEADGFNTSLASFGKHFFLNVQTACHDLICGSGKENEEARGKISSAFHLGKEQLATAIATLLITGLNVAAPIAGALAVIIIQLVVKPGIASLCEAWHPDASLASM